MSRLKTDALPSKSILSNYAEILDKGVLSAIENDLTINEKISLVFLCAAEKIDGDFYSRFMQKLIKFNEKIIFNKDGDEISLVYDFIENISNWRDKFVEALCIINNKKIINQLGLIVDDLFREFCPLQAKLVRKINVGAKVLFVYFESLGEKESDKILKKIYSDIKIDERLSEINLMELHAIYWLSIGFIQITPANGDVTNLLKYLKPLGYSDTPSYQDMEWFNKKYAAKNKSSNNQNTNVLTKFKSLLNLTKPPEEMDSDEILIKKGFCLIINEINFQNSHEERRGSKADVSNLRKTFQKLNFIVEDYENLSRIDIWKKIHTNAEAKNKNYDCFVVCLLSHGYAGGIFSVDDRKITFEEIDKCICQKELQNALKLVIVQACQGETTGINSPRDNLAVDGAAAGNTKSKPFKNLFTDGYAKKPAKSLDWRKEFLLFKSTMKDYVAIRDTEAGSWFIADVCGVLNGIETKLSVDDWSRQVKKKISLRYGKVNGYKVAGQLAETESDRRTKNYFFFKSASSDC